MNYSVVILKEVFFPGRNVICEKDLKKIYISFYVLDIIL